MADDDVDHESFENMSFRFCSLRMMAMAAERESS